MFLILLCVCNPVSFTRSGYHVCLLFLINVPYRICSKITIMCQCCLSKKTNPYRANSDVTMFKVGCGRTESLFYYSLLSLYFQRK